MAKRLNDKEKKEIIAYYIECQNYSETSRKYNVSVDTVKRLATEDEEIVRNLKQKKQENTKDIITEMNNTKNKRINLLNKMLDKMEEKVENVDVLTNVKDLATAYGIIIDKDLKFAEISKEKEEKDSQAVVRLPAKDLPPAFINVYRSIWNEEYQEYMLEGGRGSIKSSFVSEEVIELLENNPNMCAIVIRRYTNTLKDSVGAQLEWAVSQFDETYPWMSEDYTFKKSPLEIIKNSTKQRIYFRGADDPGKIKSIKPPKGMYIGIIWYEEFDQMQGMNSVRKINQSIVRGGEKFFIFFTYNTPPSRQHFVNKEKKMPKKNRLVHLSDYRQAPKEWLGQAFIDEAEFVKETAPAIYENEYLGLETGDGGSVFENVEVRQITDDEINAFDWIYKGIDWGWYPDPFAYNNMYYNSNKRELYIFDELDCNKKSNAETWQMLKDKGVTEEDLITADSAEPKSIGDYRSYGSSIRGAVKGPRKC